MRLLVTDVQLLDELLAASGDTTVTATRETIAEVLQAMVRVLDVSPRSARELYGFGEPTAGVG